MSKKYTLLTFKGICMNFLLELNFFILSHLVTSKQPHKIVQIHMGHPVSSSLSECIPRIYSTSKLVSVNLSILFSAQLWQLTRNMELVTYYFQYNYMYKCYFYNVEF